MQPDGADAMDQMGTANGSKLRFQQDSNGRSRDRQDQKDADARWKQAGAMDPSHLLAPECTYEMERTYSCLYTTRGTYTDEMENERGHR